MCSLVSMLPYSMVLCGEVEEGEGETAFIDQRAVTAQRAVATGSAIAAGKKDFSSAQKSCARRLFPLRPKGIPIRHDRGDGQSITYGGWA